jgi:capsular exopolysaccharide synthesis family protein
MSANQISEGYDFSKPIITTPLEKTSLLEKPVEANRSKVNAHLVSLLDPNCLEAEYYRRLRHTIECIPKQSAHKGTIIAICSPGAGDGKTITSINVAGAMAQNKDARVLLVELDLRKPFVTMKDYLGLGTLDGPGLDDTILNPNVRSGKDIPWGKVVRYISNFNLYYLPSGSIGPVPYEFLKPPRLGELLEAARQRYDYIILDTPPVVFLPDSQLIEKSVDGVFMVVAAGRTPKKMLEEALNLMDPEKILGIIFNGHTPSTIRNNGDAYAYMRVRSGLKRGHWWSRMMRKYFTAW